MTFTPSAEGIASATLTLRGNDSEAAAAATLSGTGIAGGGTGGMVGGTGGEAGETGGDIGSIGGPASYFTKLTGSGQSLTEARRTGGRGDAS